MDDEKPKGKVRHCWNCGADMGWIADKHYDRRDSCGSIECNRAEQDMHREEREEAHERLDRDMGWDRW